MIVPLKPNESIAPGHGAGDPQGGVIGFRARQAESQQLGRESAAACLGQFQFEQVLACEQLSVAAGARHGLQDLGM